MATEQKIEARDTVGLVLMGSEEADVAVEMLREEHSNLRITKTNCYWMIEGEGKIEVDVSASVSVLDVTSTCRHFLW